MKTERRKIAIIGNGGGGKTTLARALANRHSLPIIHVDSIQYLSGMKIRDVQETTNILEKLAEQERWLIDGFGTFDIMQRRFKIADKIVFVDFPLWRHYWWCTKRQIISLKNPRSELPAGCNEATFLYTIRLFKILWRVHTKIRPQLINLFQTQEIAPKVIRISTLKQWKHLFNNGIE